jgi:hypothetical protein
MDNLNKLKEGKTLVDTALIDVKHIMETLSHYELAELYVEMLDVIHSLETQVEKLFTYSKSLQLENKALRTINKKTEKKD